MWQGYAGARGRLKGRSWLLDSISTVCIGGQLVVECVLEGGECRLRSTQTLLSDGHLYSNPLGLAVHDSFHVVLNLGHFPSNLLRLGRRVPGDLGDSGGGV